METSVPTSSHASCLRCSGVTVESRITRSNPPFLTYSEVTVRGAASDNSLLNLSRYLSNNVPQEPLLPTSKTFGHETATVPSECGVGEEFVSKIRDSKTTDRESCGLLAMQPSQGRAGRGTTDEDQTARLFHATPLQSCSQGEEKKISKTNTNNTVCVLKV